MNRFDIIRIVGSDLLTTNMESGEFNYSRALAEVGKKNADSLVSSLNGKKHKFLDIRFVKGNTSVIVFIRSGAGSAGYTTYQEKDFIGMNGKTSCGYNSKLNKYNGLFLVTLLDLERPKYCYGRSWTGDRLKNTKIRLPVDDAGKPEWTFMDDCIKSLPYSANL